MYEVVLICDREDVTHCLTWPHCVGPRAVSRGVRRCVCPCADCATVQTFVDAYLFETTNAGVYDVGEIVEAVGIGKSDPQDDPGEFCSGMFIRGRGVHDGDAPVDEGDTCHWMYFRAGDLRPLTPAAARMHAELRRRNRHLPEHHR